MFTPWCVRWSCRIRKFLNGNCYDIFYCCSNSPRLTFDVLSFLCANVTPTIAMIHSPPKTVQALKTVVPKQNFSLLMTKTFNTND